MKQSTVIGIFGVAGLGVGAYFVMKALAKKNTSAPSDMPELDAPPVVNTPTPVQNTSFSQAPIESIKELQTIIGTTADGVWGPISNNALNSLGIYGPPNVNNIASLIEKAKVARRNTFIKSAQDSLTYNINGAADKKKAVWNYWVNASKYYGVNFDAEIAKTLSLKLGRSVYQAYNISSSVTPQSKAAITVAKAALSAFFPATQFFLGVEDKQPISLSQLI